MQDLTFSNFTKAFDAILCPLGSVSTLCGSNQPMQALTRAVIVLIESYAQTPVGRSTWDVLRNLFTTALWMFNPVWMGAMLRGPWQMDLQPDLAPGHYFNGSITKELNYVAPERWTVYAFVCSGAIILVFILIGLGISGLFHAPETTNFGVVDFLNVKVEFPVSTINPGNVVDVLGGIYQDDEIMYTAAGVKIKVT
jgi:hypothetical protein